MTEKNIGINPAEEDLRELFEAYRKAAEGLKSSHQALQHEVERLRKEIEQKRRLAALGEMAAVVAHEIRNSLGSIDLSASSLERELGGDKDLGLMVFRILSGVRTIDGIVSDLLDYAAEIRINPSPCSLEMVFAGALERLAGQIEHKGVTVTTEVDPQLVISADYELLIRATTNLVLNAVQEIATSGKVSVVAAETDAGVLIKITDDGPGIPEDMTENIFTPFITTKETGTGLGLAIVHRIIEAHSGTVSAANRSEGGAVFTVTLPKSPTSGVRNEENNNL